ncbi:MAG: SDR family oxidoreductase [Lachnospiraceae bacterium]|nr:SDR family oxidoreductase [Lachnospiraceae bacterium]
MNQTSPTRSSAVLITGATGGIGRAVAQAFAARGCRLYVGCAHRESLLQQFAAELSERYEIPCTPLVFDVSDAAAVREAFRPIPSLDGVIHCAGIAHFSLLQDTNDADWERTIGTDLSGAFHILKNAVPLLLRSSNARILTISSVWGSHGAAMESAYSAAKGGLDALTKSLALELAPSGIPVNAIACGVIDTDMNRGHLTAEELEELQEEIPAGRFGTPGEVAAMSLLLFDAPRYLTGQIIGLNGGWKL